MVWVGGFVTDATDAKMHVLLGSPALVEEKCLQDCFFDIASQKCGLQDLVDQNLVENN